MKHRKLPAGCAAAFLLCSMFAAAGDSVQNVRAESLQTPSQSEINAFFQAHPWDISAPTEYAESPSLTSPYTPGKLSAETEENALNCLNFCRYIAGLPADITIDSALAEKAQAATLVHALNGEASHNPKQPSGLSDTLYELGKNGAANSNLLSSSRAIPSLPYTMMIYLSDSDPSNITALGHRRWLLHPDLDATGFGHIGGYSATYVTQHTAEERFTGEGIAWPPPNMPYSLYSGYDYMRTGYAFSYMPGSSFDTPQADTVSVELTSEKTGSTYHLSRNNTAADSMYFNISQYGTVIFNPGFMFPEGDTVSVSISGLTKSGKPAPVSYQVRFFELQTEPELLPGDLDGDGKVSLHDTRNILKAYTYQMIDLKTGLTERQMRAADVNRNSKLDLRDTHLVLVYYVMNSVSKIPTEWSELLK
ncbi:MAG: hypothetical protein IJL32_08850 [Oscillospiraceae bacterium]|nr:hypothetical protein [Oscillospiraceae bacterium]